MNPLERWRSEFLHMELPFLDTVPLDTLREIKKDEQEAFDNFRVAMKDAIRKSRGIVKEAEEAAVSSRIREIQRDLVDVEVSKLKHKYESLLRYRTVRVATGGVVGAIPLGMYVAGLPGGELVKMLLGAGGLGFAAREISEWIKDRDGLKTNPFYAIWKLKKR